MMLVPKSYGPGTLALAGVGQARPILQTAATTTAKAAPDTGPAAPFVLAAAGVMAALSFLFGRARPRQKEEASRLADEVEAQLQENLRAYQASPRTAAARQLYLANFDYAWQQFVAAVSPLGDPGLRAVEERQAGGTVPSTGGNWFVWYRDPIANDATATGGGTVAGLPLGLLAGLALCALGVLL